MLDDIAAARFGTFDASAAVEVLASSAMVIFAALGSDAWFL